MNSSKPLVPKQAVVSDKLLRPIHLPQLLRLRLDNRTNLPVLGLPHLESQHSDRAGLGAEEDLVSHPVGAGLVRRREVAHSERMRAVVLLSDKRPSDNHPNRHRPLGSHRNLQRHLANPLSHLLHSANPLSHLRHLANPLSHLRHLANPLSHLRHLVNLPSRQPDLVSLLSRPAPLANLLLDLLALGEMLLLRVPLLLHPRRVVSVRRLQRSGNLRNPPLRLDNPANLRVLLANQVSLIRHSASHHNRLLHSVRPQHRRARVSVNLLQPLDSPHSQVQHLVSRVYRMLRLLRQAHRQDLFNLRSPRSGRPDSVPVPVRVRHLPSASLVRR